MIYEYYGEEISKEEALEILCEDGLELENMNPKTEELVEEALRCNGLALNCLSEKEMTEAACLMAIADDPVAIQFVNQPTESMCAFAISVGGGRILPCIHYEYRTKVVCEMAVKSDPRAIKYVPEKFRTDEMCLSAIFKNPGVINLLPHPTLEMYKVACERNALIFRHILDPKTKEDVRQHLLELQHQDLEVVCNG